MILENIVKKNSYYDSATLMLLTSKIGKQIGNAKDVSVMMGTDNNKDLMSVAGLLSKDGSDATANDIVIAIRAKDQNVINDTLIMIEDELSRKNRDNTTTEKAVYTVEEAIDKKPESNIAVVSLPGEYAGREVRKLLESNVNVLLFSDNISIEEEIALKDLALEKNLLMMGPDCGTAIINGVGLGFSNKVKKGPIGIVAASGTGLQEVATLVSNNGYGISHALGTGGRDVTEQVGGRMMLACLEMLENDNDTEVIVIVSKPPSTNVLKEVMNKIYMMNKKVITCFLNGDLEVLKKSGIDYAETLEEAAIKAIKAIDKSGDVKKSNDLDNTLNESKDKLNLNQKYIRGLYCGGTLAYESMLLLRKEVGKVYSNIAVSPEEMLQDTSISKEHTILDLGDDEFTRGKPHPMIDPSLRGERLISESMDEEVAVVLLDVELGYGSHDNPASILTEEVIYAKNHLSQLGREVIYVASICGTFDDYQDYDYQKNLLESVGVHVMNSNAEAIRLAMKIVS
ncbi:MAG: acyl-CoA synthetase FdrA [Erysipelothrix sp.]|nr:acyl-CoA synthetase FdrA [Erysipelothrix sp.]